MPEFKLPDVGEGLTEADIVTWRVKPGDVIKVNDVLVDIETAKSIVELPSPYAGEVGELLVAEGDTVTVGTPVIRIGGADEAAAPAEAAPKAVAADEPKAERQAVLVGYGAVADTTTRRRRRSAGGPSRVASVDTEKVAERGAPQPPVEQPSAPSPETAVPAPQVPPRTLARPPVRKLAKDLGIDLASVPCEGDFVTRAEVEAFAANGSSTPAASAPAPVMTTADDVRVPIKGVRKMTAQAMVDSAFTAPHVTEWVTVDVTRTVELVDRLKADRRFKDVKMSPTVIIAKAICLAMRRTPELNSAWDEAAQEIVMKGSVTLGVAAATDRGLVVPNIPGADRMSLVELADAISELTKTARAGKTQPAQMSGGSFTLTNIGVFGVDAGTPIINPGEAGILAVGQIARRPWVDDNDEIVPRWITTLALSFDHRLVDGEQGSHFIADVAAILNDPATALTF